MALEKDLRIVESRCQVIRCQIEHRLEQQLSIVEYVPLDADAREQTHGFDVVAVLDQESADERLGRRQIAVREKRRRRHDLGREFL